MRENIEELINKFIKNINNNIKGSHIILKLILYGFFSI